MTERTKIVPTEATFTRQIDATWTDDSYSRLAELYPDEASLSDVHGAVLQLVEGAGLNSEDVLVSGFKGGVDPESLARLDARKLSAHEACHDSSVAKTKKHDIGEQVTSLENGLRELASELNKLDVRGELTEVKRRAGVEEIRKMRAELAELKRLAAEPQVDVPFYYATPVEGILNPDSEHNPLGYTGVYDDPKLAIYDRRGLVDAGIEVIPKDGDERQLRIAAMGAKVMEHCVAMLHLQFYQNEQED